MTLRSPSPTLRVLDAMGPFVTAAVIIVWVVLLWRVFPIPSGDFGVFVAVADRLNAGDRLYVDVWDNKDPVLYWVLASSRWISPFGPWLLEMLWLVVAATSAGLLAKSAGLNFRASVLVGAAMTPIIITGGAYWAGTSHQPGVALALLSAALISRRRVICGSVVLGVILFVKITVFPVAVVAACVLLWQSPQRGQQFTKAIAGAAASMISIVVLLALRGELGGYLDSIAANFSYSARAIEGAGRAATLLATSTLIIAAAIAIALALTIPPRFFWWLTVATGITAIAVIALTGKFWHHAHVMAIPAVFSAILLAKRFTPLQRGNLIGVAAGLVSAWLLAGAPTPNTYVDPMLYARGNISSVTAESPYLTALQRVNAPSQARFTIIGQGNDTAAAALAVDTLACPRMAQYDWESAGAFNEALACVREADVVLVASDIQPGTDSDYNQFVRELQILLAEGFTCSSEGDRTACAKR